MRLAVITGGGTGGHLFPGIAVAKEMLSTKIVSDVMFIGTKFGLEAAVVPKEGFHLETLPVSGILGKNILRKIKSLFTLPVALLKAYNLLKRVRPSIVIGVGGYASFPGMLAALLQSIPTLLLEQNLIPGITNKFFSRFATEVVVTYEESIPYLHGRGCVLGNPVRQNIIERASIEKEPHKGIHLLIFGGSQGARIINNSVIKMLSKLFNRDIAIVHQTGKSDFEMVKEAYERNHISAEILPFIDDMGHYYAWADLVICRSGAGTVAEITTLGKASILIPFAGATNDHQKKNAMALSIKGAAVTILEDELTPEKLFDAIEEMSDENKRGMIEESSRVLGRPNAATDIALLAGRLMK